MPSEKFLRKYELPAGTGTGALWLIAAFLLPLAAWTVFTFGSLEGWIPLIKPNASWAVVWLFFTLPCVMVAGRCFHWKGWGKLANTLFYLGVIAILTFPAALLVYFQLAEWPKH